MISKTRSLIDDFKTDIYSKHNLNTKIGYFMYICAYINTVVCYFR